MIACAFLGAALLSLAATPAARGLARRLHIWGRPFGREVPRRLVPLLGGLSIFAGTAVPTVILLTTSCRGWTPQPWLGAAIGSLLVLGLGVWDDSSDLRPRRKLVLQGAVAAFVTIQGAVISTVTLPGLTLNLGFLAMPLTVLWIVGMMNAWNLLDGMDGLASGVAAIAAIALGLRMISGGATPNAILFLSLAGASLGFLRYNFHPASVFMGDTGSLFIGYVFAVGSILPAGEAAAGMPLDARIPLLVCLVPVADTLAAVLRRGRTFLQVHPTWALPPWDIFRAIGAADSHHLHHQLLARGVGQRRAALLVYALAIAAAAGALVPAGRGFSWALLIVGPASFWVLLGRLGCVCPPKCAASTRFDSPSLQPLVPRQPLFQAPATRYIRLPRQVPGVASVAPSPVVTLAANPGVTLAANPCITLAANPGAVLAARRSPAHHGAHETRAA